MERGDDQWSLARARTYAVGLEDVEPIDTTEIHGAAVVHDTGMGLELAGLQTIVLVEFCKMPASGIQHAEPIGGADP